MIDEPPDVELSPQRTALSVTSAIIAWRTCAAIPKPDDGWPICPFGRIVRRADGAMFASFYNWPPVSANLKNRASALLYRSDDDGQTGAGTRSSRQTTTTKPPFIS